MTKKLGPDWKRMWQGLPLDEQPEKIVVRNKETELLLEKEAGKHQYLVREKLNLNRY